METGQKKNNNVSTNNDEVSMYYSLLQCRVHLVSHDKTITLAQLTEGIEKKYGNRAAIEASLRKNNITSALDTILKGEAIDVGRPMPSANNYPEMYHYLSDLLQRFSALHLKGSYATQQEAITSHNNNLMVEYICSLYLNEYPMNKAFLLRKLADYIPRKKRDDLVKNMNEDDWQIFRYAGNVDIASAIENILRDDGAGAVVFLEKQAEFNEAVATILDHAILHGKVNAAKAALNKYISYENSSPRMKVDMAKNALLAITEGNPEICKMFLSKDMWNTYDVTTKACILALVLQRSGTKTQVPLLQYLASENMVDSEVLVQFNQLYNSDDKEQKLDYLRSIIDSYYVNEAKSSPASNSVSRRLAGAVFLTPKDNSIPTDKLICRADVFGDSTEILETLKRRCNTDDRLELTKNILNNQNISTMHAAKGGATLEQRYAGLALFNSNYIAHKKLRNIISHAVQLDKHYSIRLNMDKSLNIDPVIKLLAFGIPELLSYSNRQAAKEKIRDDRSYFKEASNRMYEQAFPDLSAGDLIEDIFYGDGKKALSILEKNELFGMQEIIALRFAALEGRADLIEPILKKYSNTEKSGTNIEHRSDVGVVALSAALFDDKAICLLFLKYMWEFCDDRYQASLIQHIITRTSLETKQELMEYLCANALLTTGVTRQVHSLSMIEGEQNRINAFYDPFRDIQNEMSQCIKSTRKPEEILSNIVKNEAKKQTIDKQNNLSSEEILLNTARNEEKKHALFVELSLSCQREFAKDTLKWSSFIQNNLAKLESCYSIKEDVFKSYFSSQDFAEPTYKFLDEIRTKIAENIDIKEEKSQVTKTNKNKTKTIAKAPTIAAQNNVKVSSNPVTAYLNEGKISPEEVSQFESVNRDKKSQKNRTPVLKPAVETTATPVLKQAIDTPVERNNINTDIVTEAAQAMNIGPRIGGLLTRPAMEIDNSIRFGFFGTNEVAPAAATMENNDRPITTGEQVALTPDEAHDATIAVNTNPLITVGEKAALNPDATIAANTSPPITAGEQAALKNDKAPLAIEKESTAQQKSSALSANATSFASKEKNKKNKKSTQKNTRQNPQANASVDTPYFQNAYSYPQQSQQWQAYCAQMQQAQPQQLQAYYAQMQQAQMQQWQAYYAQMQQAQPQQLQAYYAQMQQAQPQQWQAYYAQMQQAQAQPQQSSQSSFVDRHNARAANEQNQEPSKKG